MIGADFRAAIEDASTYAREQEPNDVNSRSRCFIAALSGWLKKDEPALHEGVWGLLNIPPNDAPEAS